MDIRWWLHNFPNLLYTCTLLISPRINLEIWTDASGLWCWGGHSSRGGHVQGLWEGKQAALHINLKELEANRMSLHKLTAEEDIIHLHMSQDIVGHSILASRQAEQASRLPRKAQLVSLEVRPQDEGGS